MKEINKSPYNPQFSVKTVLKSLLVGGGAGFVAVLFRICITKAFEGGQFITQLAKTNVFVGILWFVVLIAGVVAVGKLLKAEPLIGGSGIPSLEGELKGIFNQHPIKVLVYKFISGIIAIGAGLSLGREGPCIQMGGVIGKLFTGKGDDTEKNLLLTAGGAAGLAAAFSAPLAGVMFAVEEVHKSAKADILITAIAACGVSGIVTRLMLGDAPIFNIDLSATIEFKDYWLILMLGVITGGVGAFYNYSLKKMQQGYDLIKKIPSYYKSVFPFMLWGILAFAFPYVLGGGEGLVEKITDGSFSFYMILLLFAIKLFFSVFSFASGVPGGILMLIIVLGGLVGSLFGMATQTLLINNSAIYAMAALFGAVVRAPITGILLVCEMSNAFSQLLPITITVLIAYLVAELLKSQPVYDALLTRNIALYKNRS